jgi:hypothetical protein
VVVAALVIKLGKPSHYKNERKIWGI